MLEILAAMLAMSAQGPGPSAPQGVAAVPSAPAASSVIAGAGVIAGPGVTIAGTPGAEAPVPVQAGRFTTAAEVKPILTATKPSWVAVRNYDGQDLVYVTQIWSWRCGLQAMAIGLNDEPLQDWPLPPCHEEYATPNAILEEDGLPFLTLQPGSVQRVVIELTYDDMTTDRAEYDRAQVLIP